MAGEDTSETWYVRSRGRVLGPLTWEQLLALRHRGQLARFDQLSHDKQGWVAADSVERLFPKAGTGAFIAGPDAHTPARGRPREDESSGFLILDDEAPGEAVAGPAAAAGPAAEEPLGWHYADGSTPQGPVDYPELKRLARQGRIGPATLFWRTGLEQWTPGSDLPELNRLWPFEKDPPAAQGRGSAPPPVRDAGARPVVLPPNASPLAMISLASNLLCGVGSLAAIVVGVLALRQIARSGGRLGGRQEALAGIVLGIAGLIATAIVCLRFLRGTAPTP